MENILFVYVKNTVTKVLTLKQAQGLGDKLVRDGWKHTATIEANVWIENLCNTKHTYEVYNLIEGLIK